MTFSILARDPDTGAIGGAAATGSLCVGGWVLRGQLGVGMSASQGAAPSTFWGEDVLGVMAEGAAAKLAIDQVIAQDSGRAWRQLSVLGLTGDGAAFTGDKNTEFHGAQAFEGGIAAGNLLKNDAVLPALIEGFRSARGAFSEQLLAGLFAAQAAGSDARGLQSAALLVLHPDHAPLSLRIDLSDAPLEDLAELLKRATTGDYGAWAAQVPCFSNPLRVLDDDT
ncbi:MAG: DUF1028 domain-containing protein [Maritimibacter sp.]